MRLDRFTIKAQEAIGAAKRLTEEREAQEITPERLLLALMGHEGGIVAVDYRNGRLDFTKREAA